MTEKRIRMILKKIDEAQEQKHDLRMKGKHKEAEYIEEYIRGLQDALKIATSYIE